jgi:hypothetical protein
MTPNILHTIGPAAQTMPLALIFTSRLLLTEKSLVMASPHSLNLERESISIRAATVTAALKEIHGYDHSGLND